MSTMQWGARLGRWARAVGVVTGVVVGLTACPATTPLRQAPENAVAAGFQAPPAGSLVVVLPPLDAGDAQGATPALMQALARALGAAGYRAADLSPENHARLWAEHVALVGGVFDPATGNRKPQAYAQALGNLAAQVCQQAGCQLVLMPRLVRRKADFVDGQAEWDGLRAAPKVKGESAFVKVRFTGQTAGVSLELTALQGSGRFAFLELAGVTLPFDSDVEQMSTPRAEQPLGTDAELQDAARRALRPLTGPVRP